MKTYTHMGIYDGRINFVKYILSLRLLSFSSCIYFLMIDQYRGIRGKICIYLHHRIVDSICISPICVLIISQYNNVQIRKFLKTKHLLYDNVMLRWRLFASSPLHILNIRLAHFSFKAALSSLFDVRCEPGIPYH